MCPSDHGLNFRVNVGDLVNYRFGSTAFIGIVLKVSKINLATCGVSSNQPDFTMKLLDLDGTITDWDVWRSDKIDILSEARRFGEDQVLDHPDSVVSVWNHS